MGGYYLLLFGLKNNSGYYFGGGYYSSAATITDNTVHNTFAVISHYTIYIHGIGNIIFGFIDNLNRAMKMHN